MADRTRVLICQRCGQGFMPTGNYLDFLGRWGAKVIVPVQCPNCFWTLGALPKRRGKIKWFDARKHYGFIVSEDGTEVLFRQHQLLDRSDDRSCSGQPVQFHVLDSFPHSEALNVELIERHDPY